jgi:hypothetical protein
LVITKRLPIVVAKDGVLHEDELNLIRTFVLGILYKLWNATEGTALIYIGAH